MAVSDQYGAVTRARGMKKKKNLYAPMIQEQAAQGVATQSVIAQKNREREDEALQFRDKQFDWQQEQSRLSDQQWQQEQDMQQRQFDADMAFQREQQSIAEQTQRNNMILGGISTAANVFDMAGGFDWLGTLFS